MGDAGLKSIWLTSAATYYPLTTTSFWIQHAIWGLDPAVFHVVNVLVHASCAVLLWRVLVRLNIAGAWFGAALWALHPVQVESVAWVTEMKNTQSCLFYLMSIFFFLKWLPEGREPNQVRPACYVAALFCAILAILSKSSTVMLPVVLALCAWWQERKWRWPNAVALAPFFLISLVAGSWTIWEQKFHSGALGPEWVQTWPQRLIVSGLDVWFYLGKLIWPHPLIFQYPRWEIDPARPLLYLPAVALVVGMFFLWRGRDGRLRPVFFAGSYFVVSLFPVLDFFSVYYFRYSFVGDHFQYLASIGPLVLAASGLTKAIEPLRHRSPVLRPALCGTALLILSILTWRQTLIYRDIETLWRATIAENPRSWFAHVNLGAHLGKTGRDTEAISHLQQASEINPQVTEPLNGLSTLYLGAGRVEEAAERARQALKIDPHDAEGHGNLGAALLQMGRVTEAIQQLEKSIEIDPSYVEVYSNLGFAYSQFGRLKASLATLQRAVEIEPTYSAAHYNLANTLLQLGRPAEALTQLQDALDLDPGDAEAQNNMAWILATSPDASVRNGSKAVELAQVASELTDGDNPVIVATLAAALAENGNFPDAQATAEKALRMASYSRKPELAAEIRKQLDSYRSAQPYRDHRYEGHDTK